MQFTETPLAGAFIIDPKPIHDDRGYFTRTWAQSEFEERGLDPTVLQCNLSWNKAKGTLRGLHFQTAPYAEIKLIRCTRGRLLDVIVDLRRDSATYCQPFAIELSADTQRMLYVPKGFAHGYITLADDVEAYYHVSTPYAPGHASGVRWNDPAFAIDWPMTPSVISERDRQWPDFEK